MLGGLAPGGFAHVLQLVGVVDELLCSIVDVVAELVETASLLSQQLSLHCRVELYTLAERP